MVEYPSHERAAAQVKGLALDLGCKLLINDSGVYGKDGFRFPRQETGKGPLSWIADVYADYKGHRVILEIDGEVGHKSQAARETEKFRKEFLRFHYGIVTVRYNVKWIKDLIAEDLRKDIEHGLMEAQKLVQFAKQQSQ